MVENGSRSIGCLEILELADFGSAHSVDLRQQD